MYYVYWKPKVISRKDPSTYYLGSEMENNTRKIWREICAE